ncbi:olfactory receptor 14J1-like [Suncus etruscus]|uniref:olfactory receptor 14J1-like n=1 Tax=Suncus etruscus TaxID=109475 RepID=UPI00210F2719|nr:olfactory receptor 14J1-like [Suncus etruscus]
MINITTSDFLLMGFSANPELEIIYASLILVLYLLALTSNILIITTTSMDESLNSPMYFFLKHLSFLDICYISVTVPRFIYNSFMHNRNISLWECTLQCFAFILCASTETFLLTVMSYDRYVAICYPLHYDIIMDVRTCVHGIIGVWVSGAISGVMHAAATFSIHFCGPRIIHQFFCDIPQIMKLSCSNDYLGEVGVIVFTALLAFICVIFIGFSYMHIFSSVLRITSAEGRAKAFSTCLPHLIIVMLYIFTSAFEFLKPHSESPTALDILLTIFYTVVPPTFNPMIYSLRNKTIKLALGKLFKRKKGAVFPRLHKTKSQAEAEFRILHLPHLFQKTSHLFLRRVLPTHTVVRLPVEQSLSHWPAMSMLTVMSYDRYVAICLPLYYDIMMDVRTCVHGIAGVWEKLTLAK